MRFAALLPTALAIVAFVLSMLCLFAGNKPTFMEDYDIIRLNTSTLGHNLIPNLTGPKGPIPSDTILPDFIDDAINGAVDDVTGVVNGIANDVADVVTEELGIHQWYSLHVQTMCHGSFTPNATAKGAGKNETSCTREVSMSNFNITGVIEKELQEGKLKIKINDLKWPPEIQDNLDKLNTALDASFILYCIGIGAAGLSVLTSLLAVFLTSRLFSLANGALAALSFGCLLITSVIVTIVQNKATETLNKYGNRIGLYAYKGTKYLTLTWVTVAAMFVSLVMWALFFFKGRKEKRREYTEKSSWRDRRSDEHHLGRSSV